MKRKKEKQQTRVYKNLLKQFFFLFVSFKKCLKHHRHYCEEEKEREREKQWKINNKKKTNDGNENVLKPIKINPNNNEHSTNPSVNKLNALVVIVISQFFLLFSLFFFFLFSENKYLFFPFVFYLESKKNVGNKCLFNYDVKWSNVDVDFNIFFLSFQRYFDVLCIYSALETSEGKREWKTS